MTSAASIGNLTIGQLVAEKPQRGRVFEQLGIDYCCGGRKMLQEVCDQKGLDSQHVRALIDACDATVPVVGEPDWNSVPLSQLISNIETTHHQFMRTELERTGALVKKVANVHGRHHPELFELERLFELFVQDLLPHMHKEETVLFPWIRSMTDGDRAHAAPESLVQPIRALMQEHDAAGAILLRMRELTSGFTPPIDACGTYRVMLSALSDIERDMHQHVHKENNILFHRASGIADARA